MDGRNRHRGPPSQPQPHHILMEDPNRYPVNHRGRPHPLEERMLAQHHDIQTLLVDNQRLAATHVALKQDFAAVQQELRHVAAAASNVKADRDAQIREVYDKSLALETEARAVNAMNEELVQVREDVKKLNAAKLEMERELQAVNEEVLRVRSGVHNASGVHSAEIETMQEELQRGRAAIEYEKKTYAENLEQSQSMENSMAVMANEVEKLRAELANAEKRARAAAAAAADPGPGYAGGYGNTGMAYGGNTEMGYGGNFYADPYSMSQIHGGADGGPQFGSGALLHGSYGAHVHR